MAVTTPADLLDAITRHGLLDPREASELAAVRSRCPDLPSLRAELRTRGWLTDYQLARLLDGAAADLVLGSYLLLEPIGQGGMGQVFKARHQLMRRLVALKLIRPDLLTDPLVVARFRQEIQLVAQLQHPNIVLAHDAQQHGDRHFLVMEYCVGLNLRQVVEENGPVPVGWGCDLMRQVALGLQHAHEHGLIHRDIKPDNLLLVSGDSSIRAKRSITTHQVKILDFGLARLLVRGNGVDSPFTQAGLLCGTPDFVAPEQASDPRQADIRADLYSLGCTFYFLLTGQAPFPGGTAVEKILRHRLTEPVPLTQHRPEVPAPVGAIVARLMRKEPGQRFQTPGELAVALANLGLSIEAPNRSAVSPPATDELTSSENPVTVTAPSLPAPGGSAAPPMTLPTQRPLQRILQIIGGLLILAGPVLAVAWWLRREASSPPTLPVRTEATHRDADKVPAPGVGDPSQWQLIHTLKPHSNMPLCARFSTDGKLLAVGCGCWNYNGEPASLKVWDLATGVERVHRKDVHDVFFLAFSPDGRTLATAHWDHADGKAEVILWEVATWQPRQRLPVAPMRVVRLAFSPDGKRLAAAGMTKYIRIWDLSGARAQHVGDRPVLDSPITAIEYSPDGTMIATGGINLPVQLWSAAMLDSPRALPGGALAATNTTALSFSRDGKRLAAVTSNWPGRIAPSCGSGTCKAIAFSAWSGTAGISRSVRSPRTAAASSPRMPNRFSTGRSIVRNHRSRSTRPETGSMMSRSPRTALCSPRRKSATEA